MDATCKISSSQSIEKMNRQKGRHCQANHTDPKGSKSENQAVK